MVGDEGAGERDLAWLLDDLASRVNYFETRELPFIVAVNCFDDAPRYDLAEIRLARPRR